MRGPVIEKLYDFREVTVTEKLLELKVSQDTIDEMLGTAAERFLTIEPISDGIRPGDIVAVLLSDGEESRRVQINVGLGFVEQAVEEVLPGLRCGDDLPTVAGVSGKVVSVKRRVIPPLTDSLIQRLGVEGVSTVAEYRDYSFRQAVQQAKQKKAPALVDFVIKSVLERSDHRMPDLDDADYRLLQQMAEQQWKQMADKPDNASWETLQKQCVDMALRAAAGRICAGEDGVSYTREDAAAQFREYAGQAGNEGQVPSLEQLDSLLLQMYVKYFQQKIYDFYADRFRVILQ